MGSGVAHDKPNTEFADSTIQRTIKSFWTRQGLVAEGADQAHSSVTESRRISDTATTHSQGLVVDISDKVVTSGDTRPLLRALWTADAKLLHPVN